MQLKSLAILMIIAAAFVRLMPHPDNVTPISAMALFGAAYLHRNKWALLTPFAALFLSDLVMNNLMYAQYYDGFVWVTSWWIYAAVAAIVAIGAYFLSQKVTFTRLILASLISSLTFFALSNLSTFYTTALYPHTPEGLLACYTAGLPFLRNALMGDLFFSLAMFGTYEWYLRAKFAPQKV